MKEVKLLILGDCSIGKTSLVKRYVENEFDPCLRVKFGYEYDWKDKIETIRNEEVKISIYESSGGERFTNEGHPPFNQADACVLAFDINQLKSFESVENGKKNFKFGTIEMFQYF